MKHISALECKKFVFVSKALFDSQKAVVSRSLHYLLKTLGWMQNPLGFLNEAKAKQGQSHNHDRHKAMPIRKDSVL